MTKIKTVADLAACTDISLLKEQRKAYTDVMDTYCAAYPVLEAIRKQVTTDEDFGNFIALCIASSALTARINELEGKTND